MIWFAKYYVRYVVLVLIIGVFAYAFQLIYSLESAGVLTVFIAVTLWLVLYLTR